MIALETEVVASRHDDQARMFYYTVERGGRRWTAAIPYGDLDAHKGAGHLQRRRAHVSNVLEAAMRGKADGEE